jgi:cytochrome c-type biogenesis protein CcsB
MTAMDLVLLRAAAALYFVATVVALSAITTRRALPERLLRWALWGGVALHVASFVSRSASAGYLAVANLGETLSFLGLLLVVSFLLVQRRLPVLALSAVVVPLAFGLTLAATALKGGVQPLPPVLHSVWLPVHVGLAILGDAFLALACSASVLYLVQDRRLKAHRVRGAEPHLPSLETLDRLSHRAVVWGLVLLTLAILTGIVWAHEAWGEPRSQPWLLDPKLLFTLGAWAFYVVLLQGRVAAGWRGRFAAQLTIAGFAVIVLSLVGVNALGLGRHGGLY